MSEGEYGCVLEEACCRRCGGQGDVVAGVMGVMNLWSRRATHLDTTPGFAACMCTSTIVRKAAKLAIEDKKRAMSANDIIENLSRVLDAV